MWGNPIPFPRAKSIEKNKEINIDTINWEKILPPGKIYWRKFIEENLLKLFTWNYAWLGSSEKVACEVCHIVSSYVLLVGVIYYNACSKKRKPNPWRIGAKNWNLFVIFLIQFWKNFDFFYLQHLLLHSHVLTLFRMVDRNVEISPQNFLTYF